MKLVAPIAVFALLSAASCTAASPDPTRTAPGLDPFVDTLQERTFRWFWDVTPPETGLTPDRWPSRPFSSIAAVGFALTGYPVGVERGWITREQARERTLNTLRFFWNAPQGPDSTGVSGYRGFFYHFLDMDTGLRFGRNELSTIDTALLLAGALAAQMYFDGTDAAEAEIRALADSLYRRAEWPWFVGDSAIVTMAWRPERGFGRGRWQGYNEGMILLLLGLGSPTHPLDPEVWDAWLRTYRWGEFQGLEHVAFAPLFGHQYSHIWIDFRGIEDAYMREKGIDYFENSRRATLAQRAYAIENPMGWRDYGDQIWGLTASDGPADTTVVVDGVERRFHTYWARGAALDEIRDDGTIAPTAAGGSMPFAPQVTIDALKTMRDQYGDHLFTRYGFLDAFNPTVPAGVRVQRGELVPGVGWFDGDYLGIDQGPILLMSENHRSGLIWELMKRSPYIVRGLCRAGFTGGWLEGRCA